MNDEMRWRAVLDNDPAADGVFFYAVASTGVFCRPSCASRPPRRDRVRFFETAEALKSGLRDLGLSRRRLEDCFFQAEGCSLSAYVDRLRVERAKDLLRRGTMPAARVAFEAGFGSLSAFYRRFRAHTGCTPGQYREQEESK